jgi:hypothetical protein
LAIIVSASAFLAVLISTCAMALGNGPQEGLFNHNNDLADFIRGLSQKNANRF